MVKGAYGALVNSRDFDIGPLQMHHGAALLPVVVTDTDGERHGFVWVLGRQPSGSGPQADCWMTDAVFRAP